MNYGLPWTNSGRTVHGNTIFQDVATAQNIELAAYIAHAANAYPRLVAALRLAMLHVPSAGKARDVCDALLAELGE